jgi:uncharacterized protein (DUF927 family)
MQNAEKESFANDPSNETSGPPNIAPNPLTLAHELGYSLIPIRMDKKPHYQLLPKDANGKATWKPYQNRHPNEDELQRWLMMKPPAFGIVTGKISGLVVFDFDGESGRQLALRWNVRAHRKTGSGGLHWDIQYPGYPVPTLNSKAKEELGRRWPGLDIKGDGGYAVAFGSNVNGNYEWLRRDFYPDSPALVPAEVWEFLQSYKDSNNTKGASRNIPDSPDQEHLIRAALDRVGRNGGRNNAGLWLACQFRDNGYSLGEGLQAMRDYRIRCPITNTKGEVEPYTESEAQASIYEAYSRPPRAPWKRPSTPAEPSPAEPRPADSFNEPPPSASPSMDSSSPDSPTEEPLDPSESGKEPRKRRFVVTRKGVFYVNEEDHEPVTFVCSHLRVAARTRDSEGSEWGLLLQWTDSEGREREWAMPMDLMAGDGTEYRKELFRGGLRPGFSPKTHQLLAQFLLSQQPVEYALCVPRLGWHGNAYVLPDVTIPQNTPEKIIHQSPSHIQHFYRASGTLDDWRSRVSEPCRGNLRLVFAISMAFTGPLLEPFNMEGGGFNLYNATSIGKTTTQVVAGSVCGGGNGDHGFCRSWRHTSNALEVVATIHNDGLLLLDELREMADDPKEIDRCIYMLANGSGKGRQSRTASTTRPTHSWRILFFSSSELPLSEYVASVGRKLKGGVEVRFISLPADAGVGLGIFDTLNGESSAAELARKLKKAALEVYGTPFRTFLERLTTERKKYLDEAREFMTDFMSEFLPKAAAPEIGRALQRFGIVAVAGEIATEMGITGWEPGMATLAAVRCFKAWIKDRGGIGQTDMQSALRQVKFFLETHGASRFESIVTRKNYDTGDDIHNRISNRAGYWKADDSESAADGDRFFFVLPEVFRREVCAGFDYRAVAAELAKGKFLLRPDEKNLTTPVTVPTGGRIRVYVLHSRILDIDC